MKFQSFVLSCLIVQACGSLRRRLSFEQIASYEPRSQVTDHNAIDLDQQAIESQLALKTDESFEFARQVYLQGGNSKSYAEVTIPSPGLLQTLSKGAEILGTNADGVQVKGKAYENANQGALTIKIQYATSDVQASHVTCKVGAMAAFDGETTDGCFAPTGQLEIAGFTTFVSYTYDPLTGNKNGRSISGFSIQADAKMRTCNTSGGGCPYDDFMKFYNYYGVSDYGHQWVTAAFDGKSTSFTRGNANFGLYGLDGREQCIKKGTAYMNVWMYVIREFEDALDDCKRDCIKCNDDPVHAWDEGVAFYTGSLEGTDGSGSGKLIHSLADKRCQNFQTCGTTGDLLEGTSKVNYDLFSQFVVGQQNLLIGNCDAARVNQKKISQLMAVPLIQGTLRYAYIVENLEGDEKAKAEGAVFAASVLPVIHAASPEAAETIYENMKVGASSTVFADVKRAFESTYRDIGVSCADVGGLWNGGAADYYEGAGLCKDSSTSSGSGGMGGAALGILIAACAVALIALGGFLLLCSREKAGKPVFTPSTQMS